MQPRSLCWSDPKERFLRALGQLDDRARQELRQLQRSLVEELNAA